MHVHVHACVCVCGRACVNKKYVLSNDMQSHVPIIFHFITDIYKDFKVGLQFFQFVFCGYLFILLYLVPGVN